jgi:hypothetical protein
MRRPDGCRMFIFAWWADSPVGVGVPLHRLGRGVRGQLNLRRACWKGLSRAPAAQPDPLLVLAIRCQELPLRVWPDDNARALRSGTRPQSTSRADRSSRYGRGLPELVRQGGTVDQGLMDRSCRAPARGNRGRPVDAGRVLRRKEHTFAGVPSRVHAIDQTR